MNKYENGKIYTIRCRTDSSLIYVGSTIQSLCKRFYEHKKCCKNENNKNHNMLLYQVIREKGLENFYIELYKECPCENKEQLTKYEGEIIRDIGTLNKAIPGRTREEYLNENKTQICEKSKIYREINKDKIDERNQKYRCENKDKINENERKYYEKNKDKIKEKIKEYYNKNKELILKQKKDYYERTKINK